MRHRRASGESGRQAWLSGARRSKGRASSGRRSRVVDEFDVTLRARRLSGRLNSEQVPVPIEAYLELVSEGAGSVSLRYDDTLGENEAGYTMPVGSKRYIV